MILHFKTDICELRLVLEQLLLNYKISCCKEFANSSSLHRYAICNTTVLLLNKAIAYFKADKTNNLFTMGSKKKV